MGSLQVYKSYNHSYANFFRRSVWKFRTAVSCTSTRPGIGHGLG
jgi:hypothetical protein